jgi:phosphate transport system substrate-binding protein
MHHASRGQSAKNSRRFLVTLGALLVALLAAFSVIACGDDDDGNGEATEPAATDGATEPPSDLSGSIDIDGSSTVFPISEAVAEEFMNENSGVQVTVGILGTGGGFERFCAGETQISDASRPVKEEEATTCSGAGIDFIELPVAYDALSVVVNPAIDFVDCLTVEELNTIWDPAAEGTITNWNQVRADFPDRPLTLYGPGTDSGTFDYFTDVVNGEEGASRGDYTPSEDDNVLVTGVAGDANAMGYFGYAYYAQNTDQLKVLSIDPGDGNCVAPSPATVEDGSYQPLSRPIFIYVNSTDADSPEVEAFVEFYIENAPTLVPEVGYVALPSEIYSLVSERFAARTTGSVFAGGSQEGVTLEDLLAAEEGGGSGETPAATP